MRRLLDGLITAIALIFIVPTFLILLSWNAIPGDSLYPLKTGLEDVALLVLSGTPLVPKASIQFTNRRMNEATVLLSRKGSTVGYSLLVAEAKQTQTYLVQKNDSTDSTAFVQNISQYKAQIQKTREQVITQAKASGTTINTSATPAPVTTAAATPSPTGQAVVINVPTTEVITQEPTQEVIQNLNNAENELNQIQEQVQSENFNNDHNQGQGHGQGQGGGQDHQNQQHQNQQNQNQNQTAPPQTEAPTTSPGQTSPTP